MLNSSFFLFLFSPKTGRYYYGVRGFKKKEKEKNNLPSLSESPRLQRSASPPTGGKQSDKKIQPAQLANRHTGKQAKHNQSKPTKKREL